MSFQRKYYAGLVGHKINLELVSWQSRRKASLSKQLSKQDLVLLQVQELQIWMHLKLGLVQVVVAKVQVPEAHLQAGMVAIIQKPEAMVAAAEVIQAVAVIVQAVAVQAVAVIHQVVAVIHQAVAGPNNHISMSDGSLTNE